MKEGTEYNQTMMYKTLEELRSSKIKAKTKKKMRERKYKRTLDSDVSHASLQVPPTRSTGQQVEGNILVWHTCCDG